MTPVGFSFSVWKRSMRATIGGLVVLLVAAFAAACGGIPKTFYYTLQVPAAPAPTDPKTTYVLGVEHFRAPEMLRDNRMVYFESPTQVNFYEHHRWSADPATLLSEYTAEWLGSTGVFVQVKVLPVREHPDYVLGGTVRSFEEIDSDAGTKVRLALALSLVRSSDHKLVWSDERREEAPVPERGVTGVSTALNTSCAQVLREMVPGLIAQVEQDFKSSGK